MILTISGTPVGSIVFTTLAVLTISLVVLLIIRYYVPLRSTPGYLLVPIFFALWLPACIAILMPIDLASSARTDDEATRGIWLPDRLLLIWWRITYWLTFTLTWYAMRQRIPYSRSITASATDIRTGSSSPSSPNIPTRATANLETSSSTPSAPTRSTT
jgi:hypothetical protein